MWRDDAYLLDMLLAARKVCEFTAGIDRHRSNPTSLELTRPNCCFVVESVGMIESGLQRRNDMSI